MLRGLGSVVAKKRDALALGPRVVRVQFCLEGLALRLSCEGSSDRDRDRDRDLMQNVLSVGAIN